MDDRAWNQCKKWYGDKAKETAILAANILRQRGYSIDLDENTKIGHGAAQVHSANSLTYVVGIREINNNLNSRFPMNEALAPTVTCFHEVFGHGGQWRNEMQKDTPLSKILLLNDFACKNSSQYYGVDPTYTEPTRQYFRQPHEIAAQYMALKMTEKFLTAIYNAQEANDLLCQYVNLRIAAHNEFIAAPEGFHMEQPKDGRRPYMKPTEPFTSMSDVYEQFQKTFEDQVFQTAGYKLSKGSTDYTARLINRRRTTFGKAWDRHKINQIISRPTQTYVLASAWLCQHEFGSWIKEMPAFAHMDFPETIPQMMKNAPPEPDKKDLDLNLLTEEEIDFTEAVKRITEPQNQLKL